eukprot:scaffold754_cov248-Pinguiococcus_pyrenoidosus.AAC.19
MQCLRQRDEIRAAALVALFQVRQCELRCGRERVQLVRGLRKLLLTTLLVVALLLIRKERLRLDYWANKVEQQAPEAVEILPGGGAQRFAQGKVITARAVSALQRCELSLGCLRCRPQLFPKGCHTAPHGVATLQLLERRRKTTADFQADLAGKPDPNG